MTVYMAIVVRNAGENLGDQMNDSITAFVAVGITNALEMISVEKGDNKGIE